MKNILKFSLFLIISFFLIGCSQDSLPDEEDTTISQPNVDTTELVPTSFFYNSPTNIFFQNRPITNFLPNINGDLSTMEYSISPLLPEGLTFNTETGEISGIPVSLQGDINYTIQAENDYGLVSYTLSIRIVEPPPQSISYTISDEVFSRNIAISSYLPSTIGNIDSFSIDPALPNGLTFNTETGEISGIPFELRSRREFTVSAINSSGSISYSFFMTVIDIPPSNLFYDVPDATYSVNELINANNPNSSGGAIDLYVLDPIQLPPGLFFNSNNGKIEGTPLAEQPSPLTYSITALNTGGSASTTITIRILDKAPPSPVYVDNNISYIKDNPIEMNTVVCAGTDYSPEKCPDGKPTSFSINPSLPNGLFINVNNGTIYGTPTILNPLTTYTVTASNSGGTVSGELSFSIIDEEPRLLSYENNTVSIRKNEYYEADIIQNEGGPVTSWQIQPGLPNAMNFDVNSGKISGIPTATQDEKIYTITGFNSGGSFSFLYRLTVLDVPNYDFSIELTQKERLNLSEIVDKYYFKITNTSREFDDSRGINLSLPITINSPNSNISLDDTSECLSLQEFEYLSSCILIIDYKLASTNNIQINISASNVLTKTFFLDDFFDLSPTNVVLLSERLVINKAEVDHDPLIINKDNLAILNNNQSLVATISNANALKDDSPVVLVNELLNNNDSIIEKNEDPDDDGVDGYNTFNNLLFSNKFTASGDFNGYTGNCEINIPYIISTGCILGDFFLPSDNINQSGFFSINLGVEEGLDSEVTESNKIPINFYKIKRIATTQNFPQRMVLHNDKIFFAALTDNENINSRKLVSYDPITNMVNQTFAFLEVGDDRAFPVQSYQNLLLLKGRNPSNATISYYIYDELQNKVEHLLCKNCTASGGFQTTLLSKTTDDEDYSFIYDNKMFIEAREADVVGTKTYLYYYNKQNNTMKRAFNPFYISENNDNGNINKNSIRQFNNKLYFEAYTDNGVSGGNKLNSYDIQNNRHNLVINRNGANNDDNLNNPFIYDNKIFYITKGVGNVASELVYYSDVGSEEFIKVFSTNIVGDGQILGIHYSKLFFTLPDSNNTQGLYFYDALDQQIRKVYSTNEEIIKISKYANFLNKQNLFFLEYDSIQDRYALNMLVQEGLDLKIKKVVDKNQGLFLNNNMTLFNFDNQFFFNCGFNLESICVYNDEYENLSLIAENIKINSEIALPNQIPNGILLHDDRIYIGTEQNSRGEKSGVYMICKRDLNDCL